MAVDVAEHGAAGAAQGGIITAVEHDADDLGHLGTGNGGVGVESAGVLALEHAQGRHDVNGLGVLDLIGIGEILVRSGSSDGHHAGEHGAGQSQAENSLEVLHEELLLFKI